jgi:hypothetical protein
MSRKDDFDSEFEALMKGIGVQPKIKKKTATPGNQQKSQNRPSHRAHASKRVSRLDAQTTKNVKNDSGQLDISLQDFTDSIDNLSDLKNELKNLKQQFDIVTIQNKTLVGNKQKQSDDICNLEQEVSRLNQLITKLSEDNITLQTDLEQKEEQHKNVQNNWQLEKETFLLSRTKEVAVSTPENSDQNLFSPLKQLCKQRGLTSATDLQLIVEHIATNTEHCGNVHCNESLFQSLNNEISLIGSHLSSIHPKIPGLVIPVHPDKCELSRGIDINLICRQLITEFLLCNWKKNLLLGVPEKYQGLFRELFAHESITVCISSESHTLQQNNDYDVIIEHNIMGSSHLSCKINFSENMTSIGETLYKVLQSIEAISEK